MSELALLDAEPLPLTPERREAVVRARLDYLASAIEPRFAQPLVDPVAGVPGYQELLAPENPASGSDFRYLVPGEEVVRPLSIMARLTTSAAVAERSLTLEYRDGQDVRYLVAGVQATLAAGQVNSFCWHPLAGDVAWPVDDVAIAPLPQQMIYPTHSLVLKIGNVQAGDQLDLIRLSVEKFKTGDAV